MDYLDVCQQAVRRAGKVLRARLGKVSVRLKGRADLVTEADLAAQEVIRQTVLGAFPDHILLGEEDASPRLGPMPAGGFRWIADPLDGTTNFVHQVPLFGVSLALEHDGKLLVGAVYDPIRDECFTATAGRGAMCNGQPIHTSQVKTLGDALVAAGFPAVVEADARELRLFVAAVQVCQALRRTGSAALNLAYVAAGRFDAAWSLSTEGLGRGRRRDLDPGSRRSSRLRRRAWLTVGRWHVLGRRESGTPCRVDGVGPREMRVRQGRMQSAK